MEIGLENGLDLGFLLKSFFFLIYGRTHFLNGDIDRFFMTMEDRSTYRERESWSVEIKEERIGRLIDSRRDE